MEDNPDENIMEFLEKMNTKMDREFSEVKACMKEAIDELNDP